MAGLPDNRGLPSEPKANILLVDDNPANLLALRALLEGLGQNLVEARCGEEAIRQAQAAEFAVILLDVLMPGINGFETAKAIRTQERSRHTPVIFLTASDMDRGQMELGYALGAVDFLVKPLLPIAIQAKVRGFVQLFQDKQRTKNEADQLRLLVEGATDYAIFRLDPQGNVASWNAGAQRIKQYLPDEIIGQHFSRFYPEDAIGRGWPTHELKVAKAEGRFEDEGWRVRKDGTQFWANVVITALYNDAGMFRGFSKITRDLTDRKRSEESERRLLEEATARRVAEENARLIQEQRERLRVTLASIGDAVISTDAQGRVDFLNPVAEALVGWKTKDAAGRDLEDVFRIVNETTRQSVENPARRAIKEGVIVGLANHTVLVSKDGTERPIDDSAAPIRDADGNVIGSVLVFRDVSEQRQANLTSLRNQELLQLIHKIGKIGHWEWNSLTDENNWSPEIEALYGLPPGGFEGGYQGWAKRLHPDDLPRAEADVRRALETGEYFSEFRVIWPDGSVHWLETRAHVFKDGDGKAVRIMGVNMDITERKQQEAALQESEGRFRGLMEQAPFSIQVFSPDGRTLRVNRAWEKLWGLTFDQVADYNVLEDPQLEAKGVLPHLRRAFAGTPSHIPAIQYDPNETIPNRTVHRDPLRWVAATAYPLHDKTGKLWEVVLVHEDITARRRAEAAVEESEEKLRLLADTIPQLAWMARPDGYIFWFNRRSYDYTAMTKDQLIGWGWQALLDPGASSQVLDGWKNAIDTGDPFEMVFSLQGADNQFRPFLTRVNPLKDDDGRVRYWFGTNTDISEIKRMEQSLRDADRRKDEFLATLAHELRNPLAPIRNSLQILKMPRVDTAIARQTRDMMERQVHHLIRLVDDLLDVSRVMRGKIELRREPVELATIVARAVETVQPLIEVQGHQLDLSIAQESLLLDADAVRLTQVVGNLLTNSAKYTEPNGHIEVTANREGGEGVLRIRDSGIGIVPSMLPQVFELFVQADHTSTKAQGGLGIGLTLVKNLVEMHGGTVEGHSAGLGKGSEFVVRLPLLIREPQQPMEHEGDASPREIASSGHRLLVVDDNQDAAISLAMLLRLQGHEVRIAHDGATALEAAKEFVPALVFLDIGMPGMDGYEVARRLRQHPSLVNVVLAALTGWGQQEDRRRTTEAGFNYHLVKPAELKALDDVLAGLK
jgi:PAS domain S-box-containing protein